jgi:hypothetical protein
MSRPKLDKKDASRTAVDALRGLSASTEEKLRRRKGGQERTGKGVVKLPEPIGYFLYRGL